MNLNAFSASEILIRFPASMIKEVGLVLLTVSVLAGCSMDSAPNLKNSSSVDANNPGGSGGAGVGALLQTDGEFTGGTHSTVKTSSGFSSSGSIGAPVKEVKLKTPLGYKVYFTVQGQTFSNTVQ